MNLLNSAKNILGSIAPGIATALGGPLAGLAVKQLLPALGIDPNKEISAEEVSNAIQNANPEQLLAMKKVDNDFKLQMKNLDVDLVKISADDRNSARKREVDLRDYTPRILAYLICILYISVQGYLLTHVIDASMREMVMRALGTLDAMLGLIFSYYFGSSTGEAKARQIENSKL